MNVFKQFYKSIYSPKDIAFVRFQGIGKSILYVFLLALISILPSVFFISASISSGVKASKIIIKDELPSFSINKGLLTAKTNVPITIDKKDFTIVLDPTGAVTDKDLAGSRNTFAILKNEFVFITGGQTDTYSYSLLQGITVTNIDLLNLLDTFNSIKIFILPLIGIILYLFTSAKSFIEISVLASFGILLKKLAARRLNYQQLWKMTAYSETLPTVFFTIMTTLKTTVPYGFLINWLVVLIVLLISINEIPKPKEPI